jgi:predicted transcriptional regulator
MLLVMFEKGLVKRDDSRRPLVYRAAESRNSTQRRMLKDLIQKAYDGSAASLVLQALSSQKTSRSDLDEIRRLVDELKRKTT